MAKPIKGVPVLKGKIAKDFAKYLRESQPDAKKRAQIKNDLAFRETVEVID